MPNLLDAIRQFVISGQNDQQYPYAPDPRSFSPKNTPQPQAPSVNQPALPQMNPPSPLMPQIPNFAQTPPFVPPTSAQPQADQSGGNGFIELMKALGLPLLSTGIGLASERALPGAAGFSQGYVSGYENQKDRQSKEDIVNKKISSQESGGTKKIYTFDPDTGDIFDTGMELPRGADLRNLTASKRKKIDELMAELNIPDVQTGEAVKGAEGKVKEVRDNGKYERAKQALTSGGRDTSDTSIKKFLELNPDF